MGRSEDERIVRKTGDTSATASRRDDDDGDNGRVTENGSDPTRTGRVAVETKRAAFAAVPEKVDAAYPDARLADLAGVGTRIEGEDVEAKRATLAAVPEEVLPAHPDARLADMAGVGLVTSGLELRPADDWRGLTEMSGPLRTSQEQPFEVRLPPGSSVGGLRDGRGPSRPGAIMVPGVESEGRIMVEMEEGSIFNSSEALGAPLSARVVSEQGEVRRGSQRGSTLALRHIIPEEEGVVYDGVAVKGGRGKCLIGRKFLVLFTLVSAIAAAAVAITVVMTRPNASSSASTEDGGTAIDVITLPPLPTQPPSQRFQLIEARLVELLPGSSAALSDSSSPQYEALMWLVYKDALQIDPLDGKGLVQRFTLSTLYFATGGERSWLEQLNFLSGHHECFWNQEVPEFGTGVPYKGALCTRDNETVDILQIPENNLTGSLNNEIGEMSDLVALSLFGNAISGSLPSTIGQLSKLRQLSLYLNEITGSIPSAMGRLSNLEILLLPVNALSGAIPNSFSGLHSLTGLFLSQNLLTGRLPSALNNLTKLETIFVEENMLTGSLPFTPGSFPNLRVLSMQENGLSGSIPRSIFTYSNLESLTIARNNFVGTVPNEIGELTKLTSLILLNNSLWGTLPASIARLKQLNWLDVAMNRLSGTVFDEIGTLASLRILYLSQNRFTGEIPSTIGNLSALEDLQLQGNYFTGTVSQSFSQLRSLFALGLENNSITGDLDFLCEIPFTFLVADCFGDEPEVRCECCHACCSDVLGKNGPVFGCFPRP